MVGTEPERVEPKVSEQKNDTEANHRKTSISLILTLKATYTTDNHTRFPIIWKTQKVTLRLTFEEEGCVDSLVCLPTTSLPNQLPDGASVIANPVRYITSTAHPIPAKTMRAAVTKKPAAQRAAKNLKGKGLLARRLFTLNSTPVPPRIP